jgi:hypothetical protein
LADAVRYRWTRQRRQRVNADNAANRSTPPMGQRRQCRQWVNADNAANGSTPCVFVTEELEKLSNYRFGEGVTT